MNGLRFPEDFDRIDKVKPGDKLLIHDTSDGIDKYATPGQFNKSLNELETHYQDAIDAAKLSTEGAKAALESKEDAEDARDESVKKAEEAKVSEENAKKYAKDAEDTSQIAILHEEALPGVLAALYTNVEALKQHITEAERNALEAEIFANILLRLKAIEKVLNIKVI